MRDVDAVIIGSGSGGLTAALALARAGRRVAVFEQHYLPGGYSQTFSMKGFHFSPGIHYVGALDPGGSLRRIYEGLGVANDLEFFELDPDGYDRVFVGDARFDIPKGKDRFRDRLIAHFPSEAEGITRYFDLVTRMIDEMGYATPIHSVREAWTAVTHARTLLRHGARPLSDFLDDCTRHPMVRAILSIQAGDHGMAPGRAPTALHAGLQGYYFDGGCYPRGGGHHIADTLVAHIKAHHGEVHLSTEVASVLIEGGAAIGVRLADGQEVRAPLVISNADPGVTWGRLVAPEHQGHRLRRRIRHLRFSISTLSLFMAVDMDLRAAGIDSGNIWFSRTPDIDAVYGLADLETLTGREEVPGLFFNATTLKDPTMRRDGLHTVEAMTVASVVPFEQWLDTPRGHRPSEYHQLKADLTERIFDAIECFLPGVRDHVVMHTLGTPLSNVHYLHATDGGIYGTEKTVGNLGPFSFPTETHIRGLYQCGASIIAPGINGVTHSGLRAAATALGCAPDDLLTATGQSLRIYPAEQPDAWPDSVR